MSAIDAMIARHKELKGFLESHDEPSFRVEVDAYFRKLLVISMGSFFERRLCSLVEEFLRNQNDDARAAEFGIVKGIKRQYHSWFAWERNNANTFFALFGETYKAKCEKECASNSELERAIRDFMKIGRTRNLLAHGDPATTPMDDTLDELEASFQSALRFVKFVEDEFRSTRRTRTPIWVEPTD